MQVEPQFRRAYGTNEPKLAGLQVRRVTQRRPRDPLPGVAIVRLNLDIADAAFLPLRPEVDVVIPVDHTEAVRAESEPVEVPPVASS